MKNAETSCCASRSASARGATGCSPATSPRNTWRSTATTAHDAHGACRRGARLAWRRCRCRRPRRTTERCGSSAARRSRSCPTFVIVRVGVSTKAPSPTAALDQNSAVARKIIDFSKTFGVEARDIQTDAVNLAPVDEVGTRAERQLPAGAGWLRGQQYRAGQAVRSVAPRRVHAPGARPGRDQHRRRSVRHSAPEKATDEARQKAVEDAVRQARAGGGGQGQARQDPGDRASVRAEVARRTALPVMAVRRRARSRCRSRPGRCRSARRSRSRGRSSDQRGAGLIQIVRSAVTGFYPTVSADMLIGP